MSPHLVSSHHLTSSPCYHLTSSSHLTSPRRPASPRPQVVDPRGPREAEARPGLRHARRPPAGVQPSLPPAEEASLRHNSTALRVVRREGVLERQTLGLPCATRVGTSFVQRAASMARPKMRLTLSARARTGDLGRQQQGARPGPLGQAAAGGRAGCCGGEQGTSSRHHPHSLHEVLRC
jgi:hypothetical protein